METNEEDPLAEVRRGAQAIRTRLGGEDAAPQLVLGTETVTSVRSGEAPSRLALRKRLGR